MGKELEDKSKRIAYHEAGHVVMNLLLGLPFKEVSIELLKKIVYENNNDQKIPIIHIVTKGVTWPDNRTKSVNKKILAGVLDLREALASMAGPQAEAMFINKIDEDAQLGAQIDFHLMLACCRAAIAPGESINNWKPSIMENYILQPFVLQAQELLKQNWAGVEAVASALLERNNLTYLEARSYFNNSNASPH